MKEAGLEKTAADKELRAIMAKAMSNLGLWNKVIFPKAFHRPYGRKIHIPMYRVIDNRYPKGKRKRLIAAPRGTGKTTSVGTGYASREICFQRKRFIVYVSFSSSHAMEQTEALKTELEENERIRMLFGDLKSEDWDKEAWTTSTGIRVWPRGMGQQIRGGRVRMPDGSYARPDLFIVDDLEDPSRASTEEQRLKTKQWFYASLMGAVDQADDSWEILMVGTLLHHQSLLAEILDEVAEADKSGRPTEWDAVRLELFDDDKRSLYPEYISDEQIAKMYDDFEGRNVLDQLFMEYRNLPFDPAKQTFRGENFQHFSEGDVNFKEPGMVSLVLIDPAKTVTEMSDETAIVGVTIDMNLHRIFVRDIVHGHFRPHDMFRQAVEMARALDTYTIAYETTTLHEFITQPLLDYCGKVGFMVNPVELTARKSKVERVGALEPYYRRGRVWHNKACSTALEQQLLTYPKSAHWDIMDALAYIVPLMRKGGIEFFGNIEGDGVLADMDKDFMARCAEEDRRMAVDSREVYAF